MTARSVVHIGFHKTGSTSIQAFLWRHRERLAGNGILLYEGRHIPSNHVELHTAALRPERITPFKLKRGLSGGAACRAEAEAWLAAFHEKAGAGVTALFTAEGLSYLRWPDELAWLRSVLRGPVTVVAYLRRLPDFEAAYRYNLDTHDMPPSDDPESVAYVEPDSWLWDYEERLRPFRETFGAQNVVALDYDAETARDGSVIPSMLRTLGVGHAFRPEEWADVRLNRRPAGR